MSQLGDRNMLFGILALQMDFISREDLVAAATVWVEDRSRTLAEILYQRQAIDEAVCNLLQELVAKHLEHREDDAEESLASSHLIDSVRDELESIVHSKLRETTLRTTVAPPEDPWATQPPSKDSTQLDTLAAAHAEAGDFVKAVAYQQQAIDLLPASAANDLQAKLLSRLDLYNSNKPYRQPVMSAGSGNPQ